MNDVVKQAIENVAEEKPPVVIEGAVPAPNPFADEDAALKQLEEQAAAEAAQAAPKPAAPAPEATPPVTPPEKDGEAKAVEASKTAEQGAIIALRKKAGELAAQNLVLQGQVQALSGMVKPADSVADVEPAVDVLDEIDQSYLAIAEKVDAGTMTEMEAETERRALRARERELLAQQQQAPAQVNDLGLQEHLNQLVTNYPVLNKLTHDQLVPFQQLAYQQAQMEGNPIQEGPLGTKQLRERMAKLADSFYNPKAEAKPEVIQPKPGEAKLSETAEQREAKLTLAANMPPDIGKIGAGATGGEVTEEQALAALTAFGGNEDAQIKWLEQHPQFVSRVIGRSMRPR